MLADVLMNDIPQNGITVRLDAKVDGAAVDLAASIPGTELLAQASDKPVLLDVFFYVFDERNTVADWKYGRVTLDVQKGREFHAGNPYGMRVHFDLGLGRYAAKVLVKVTGSEITGFQRSDFEIVSP